MKELTHEVKETYAWEANDGKIFYDQNECLQYEKTAKCAITARLREMFVGGNDPVTEYQVFEGYGGSSEEYLMAVLFIKDENDLYAVNQYASFVGAPTVSSCRVGDKLLVGLGTGMITCMCTVHIMKSHTSLISRCTICSV